MKVCEAHLPCIYCRVKSRTAPERSVILLDQNSASVWNFWWNYTPLLDMISFSSFLFWDMASFFTWAFMCSSFFSSFGYFWDLHCVLFSILRDLHVSRSFWIALLSLSRNMLERSYFRAWSNYFGGDGKHVLACSQCRNSSLLWCVREFWSWEHETSLNRGHKNLIKLNTK